MNALAKADRAKLAKVLGLLDSDREGEALAAARAAARLVKQRGIGWAQVLEPPPIEKTLPELGTWRQTVARCLERPGSLRSWEVGFLRDLPGFRRLSGKQRYCLKEIADRVLSREAAQ
jgi:hypothetical protein